MGEHGRVHNRRTEGDPRRHEDLRAREADAFDETLHLEQYRLFPEGTPPSLRLLSYLTSDYKGRRV